MKKYLLLIFMGLILGFSVSAQNEQEDLKIDMEEMQKELERAFKDMDIKMGESKILIDTMFFKGMDQMGQLNEGMLKMLPKMMESIDMEAMMEMMTQSLKQLEQLDMSEFEELFKGFDLGELKGLPRDPKQKEKSNRPPAKKL